uniref:Sas10 C-terminal domain-containing protein n=1 Tax=Timema shepardi TaxID=629360 RepID=A0A7R9AX94_TIMSH|nr:unnamed protein product [Timema shepardi]
MLSSTAEDGEIEVRISVGSVEMDDLDEYVPSDSEDEYSENEKILLEKTRKGRSRNIIDSEEEVFGLHDSDDDDGGKKGDGVADSDLDAQEDGDDLPNVRAWGQSKRDFYHTDYVDQDYGGFDGKDAVAAEYEEQEARAIQQRLAEQLDEGDFSLDIFTKKPEEPSVVEGEEEVIKTDLSKLSKRQKLALLQKEAPEFSSLVQDFKDKNFRSSVGLMLKDNRRAQGTEFESLWGHETCQSFQQFKFLQLRQAFTVTDSFISYCTNISFYLLLKARRISVQSHPVVRRLYQYRQLLKQLEPVDQEVMTSQIDTILKLVEDGALITPAVGNGQQDSTKAKSRKLLRLLSKSQTQNVDSEDIEAVHPPVKKSKLVEMEQDADLNSQPEEEGDIAEGKSVEEDEGDEKRAITYKMAKNRGLTPYRKKELRNPRVKHRIKYRKAKIRRKGQVREPRYEIQRYGGEISGIKTSVTRSTKIK